MQAQQAQEAARQQALLQKEKEKAQQEAAKAHKISDKKAEKELRAKQKAEARAARKAASNFKYYLAFIFFVFLLFMIGFLPEINEFFNRRRIEQEQAINATITTGTLSCEMVSNDERFDYSYQATFNFRDNKMYRLNFKTTVKGDRNLDALDLSEMKNQCDLLESQISGTNGVRVSCSLNEGVYVNEQMLDYSSLNVDDVTTAYLEAGGTYPNYVYEQNIDDIEKQMKSSNYTCERRK